MTDPILSIVIPALDAAKILPATLMALSEGQGFGLVREILLVDGGSQDATRNVAKSAGARVMTAPRGRGAQLQVGAAVAQGDWLLFLHADTRLEPGWAKRVSAFIAEPKNEMRAGVFRLALDDADPRARRVEFLARWRGFILGLPYGDQGLLISRTLHGSVGGFRSLPLMEDVDMVRRIGRRRLVFLKTRAITSAARYQAEGWWLRPLRNLSLLTLYFLGVSPAWLKRRYE